MDAIVPLHLMLDLLLKKGEKIRTTASFLGEGYTMDITSFEVGSWAATDNNPGICLTGDIDGPIGEQEVDHCVPMKFFETMNLHKNRHSGHWDLY